MRALRTGRLFDLPSGLWAVDAVQPVAAVLDPRNGELRDVVSWAQQPPPPPGEVWPRPRMLSDGASLWTQQHRDGPLVRIDESGVRAAVWTDGLVLTECGPGLAWCSNAPPDQALLTGTPEPPPATSGYDQLLRVQADGSTTTVVCDAPVRDLRAHADGLVVRLDAPPASLRHLGVDTYEVEWSARWVLVPWAAAPTRLSVDGDGRPDEPAATERRAWRDGAWRGYWYEDGSDTTVTAGNLRWRLGRMVARRRARGYECVAVAFDDAERPVREVVLGAGSVTAATAAGPHLVVAVARPAPAGHDGPVDVLAIDPATGAVRTLLAGDAVDVTMSCWPLVPRPLEADAYAHDVLARQGNPNDYWQGPDGVAPLADGMRDARVELDGAWPDTCLVWTFELASRPGLLLRRRVRLFDELGRVDPPEYAAVSLMEAVDTGDLPPASLARDGILDV